jgi:phage baseplate assembly protein gpV
VQVRFPWLDESDVSPWARVVVPMAGQFYGHYFIPSVDDEVLVVFEHGDMKAPYVIGSLWNAMSPPPLSSPSNEIRAVRTPGGNQIVIEDRPSAITIQTSPNAPQSLPGTVSPSGSNHSIALTQSGIELASPTEIKLGVQTTKVTISPTSVEIVMGGSSIKLSASGVEIQAPTISLNATGPLKLQGMPVQIN